MQNVCCCEIGRKKEGLWLNISSEKEPMRRILWKWGMRMTIWLTYYWSWYSFTWGIISQWLAIFGWICIDRSEDDTTQNTNFFNVNLDFFYEKTFLYRIERIRCPTPPSRILCLKCILFDMFECLYENLPLCLWKYICVKYFMLYLQLKS